MSFINPFDITNNTNNSSTVFRNADATGTLVNSLNVDATGIYNYVPYLPLSIPVKNSVSQIGGYIDISGSSTRSVSTPVNLTSFTLPAGTYLLRGHMRLLAGTSAFNISSNLALSYFGFSSGSGTIGSGIYVSLPLEYRAGTFTISANTGEFHKHCTIIVNFTGTSNTVYLNYQMQVATSCTVGYDVSATRLA